LKLWAIDLSRTFMRDVQTVQLLTTFLIIDNCRIRW